MKLPPKNDCGVGLFDWFVVNFFVKRHLAVNDCLKGWLEPPSFGAKVCFQRLMEKYPYFDKMSRINFWYAKSNGLVNLVANYEKCWLSIGIMDLQVGMMPRQYGSSLPL